MTDDYDFEEITDYLDKSTGKLMDINHRTVQDTRKEISRLVKYKEQFCSLVDEMVEVLAIGGMLHSRITGDIIMDEHGIELVEGDTDEEAEEEE